MDNVQVKFIGLDKVIKKFEGMAEKVPQVLKDSWDELGGQVTLHLEARCPTIDQEYTLIMTGGQFQYNTPARAGETSADSDGRQRFIRAPGMWLSEAVAMPGSFVLDSDTLKMKFGNIAFLSTMTTFKWQNKNGQIDESAPVWSWFEYGGSHVVTPRSQGNKANGYLLAPGEGHGGKTAQMTKEYPAYRMFSGYNPTQIYSLVRNKLEIALKE